MGRDGVAILRGFGEIEDATIPRYRLVYLLPTIACEIRATVVCFTDWIFARCWERFSSSGQVGPWETPGVQDNNLICSIVHLNLQYLIRKFVPRMLCRELDYDSVVW